ncbi:MAG: glycosyltransferase 87 family protein [Candidatus Velthaea sp.]
MLLGVVAAAFVLYASVAIVPNVKRFLLATDFRAFYCAGQATREHVDPYLQAPLAACQQSIGRALGHPDVDVRPAPHPGYDMALFALFSVPPYVAAALCWTLVLICAYLSAVWSLARLLRLPYYVPAVALMLTDLYESSVWGQVVPLIIAALCLSAYALALRRVVLAAVAAAFAMIEPHVGLPACAALFVWEPRSRAPLGAAALVAAALAVAAIGPFANIEYFRDVLPAHALAELPTRAQFSFSVVLHYFGMPDGRAAKLGMLSYVVMTAAGIVVAGFVARRRAAPAGIVLLPPAFAVFGGVFMHHTEIAVAIPSALFLAVVPERHNVRLVAFASLFALCAYWEESIGRSLLLLDGLFLGVLTAWFAAREGFSDRRALLATMPALAAYVLGLAALGHTSHRPVVFASPPTTFVAQNHLRPNLASTEDGLTLRRDRAAKGMSPWDIARKVPSWLALIMLCGAGLAVVLLRPAARRRSEAVPHGAA